MAGPRIELPTLQSWSCHNCGGCCRQHCIEVTEEERQRILAQDWGPADGIAPDQPLLVPHAGPPWNKRYRLAHRSDGACVFLDEHGLCRIHAKHGEHAKPLPCRIYPYAFHPAGKKVVVSLRYSCPSVVSNRGKPVAAQAADLKQLSRLVVPETAEQTPPPEIKPGERLDWADTLRIVRAIDASLADEQVDVLARLLRTLFWLDLVDQASFANVRGARLDDFLEIITQASCGEVEAAGLPGEPSRAGRLQFRLLVAQYARKDTFADLAAGWRGRWKLFRAAARFAGGTGTIPPLQEGFREVPFEALEAPFGLPEGTSELFTRYFRVKIQGLHFCGPAYYGVPLVEGFRSLALIYPAILWIARWLAAGDGRTSLQLDDLQQAMAIADHHHGYSPAFGRPAFRHRVRLLAKTGDIARLCAWYGR